MPAKPPSGPLADTPANVTVSAPEVLIITTRLLALNWDRLGEIVRAGSPNL